MCHLLSLSFSPYCAKRENTQSRCFICSSKCLGEDYDIIEKKKKKEYSLDIEISIRCWKVLGVLLRPKSMQFNFSPKGVMKAIFSWSRSRTGTCQ